MKTWIHFFSFMFLVAANGGNSPLHASGNTQTLRILSYNINGLPSAFTSDKKPHYERITELLQARRNAGTHPQIVVLQEAFDGDTRVIAREAGYPYVLFGPGRADTSKRGKVHWAQQARKSYATFTNPQKFTGSGLVILSDFPIVQAQHKAFNSDECAGIDCLSNKAILLARIEVPWCSKPFDIITGHLNSLNSAAAPKRQVRRAFEKQTDVLKWFLSKTNTGNPLVLAGDFNTKQDARYKYFIDDIQLDDAGAYCVGKEGCLLADGVSGNDVWRGTNDKQFYRSSDTLSLTPRFIARPFNETLAGKPLSDHRGYEVHYSLISLVEGASLIEGALPAAGALQGGGK